jgi:DNA-binding SARP family transcriptional activator
MITENTPRLHLLRGFELRSGNTILPVPFSAQRLVAFLAIENGPVRRLRASGVLWTEATEERASSSLRSALWRTPSFGGLPLVQASTTHLWLNPIVKVDFQEVLSEAMAIIKGELGEDVSSDFGGHVEAFGNELLPGWYDDWVLVERERFRQLRLHALEALCDRLTDAGKDALAIQAGLTAVACEPLRESAHRRVMQVHLEEGNVSEAIRQFREYTKLLDEELGTVPSPSMRQLVEDFIGNHQSERPL